MTEYEAKAYGLKGPLSEKPKYETKDSGERAEFSSGMQRDTDKGKARFDLLMPLNVPYGEQLLTRFADLMTRGAEKYDPRNWEKANSVEEMERMKSSAFRHFMQWMAGEADEDHAAATLFNLLAYETTRYKVENKVVVGFDFSEPSNGMVYTATAPPGMSFDHPELVSHVKRLYHEFGKVNLPRAEPTEETLKVDAYETYCLLDGDGDWWYYDHERNGWTFTEGWSALREGFSRGRDSIVRKYGINDLEKPVPTTEPLDDFGKPYPEQPRADWVRDLIHTATPAPRDFQAGDIVEFLNPDFAFHGMTPGATYEVLEASRDSEFVTVANDDVKRVRIWAGRFRLHIAADEAAA